MTTPTPPAAGDNAPIDSGGPATSEPVLLSHTVTTILYAAVGAGWLTIPDPTINEIATVAALALSTVGALAARARVSPSGRITWATVRESLQDMLYDELDRLTASYVPARAAELAAPLPAAPPVALEKTVAAPAVSAPAAPVLAGPGVPVGTFTTTAAFGPAPSMADESPTAIQPVVASPPSPKPQPAAPTPAP